MHLFVCLLLFVVACDDSVEVLVGERVEVMQEGTHAPPLSDKFHSIIPEPELTPEPS